MGTTQDNPLVAPAIFTAEEQHDRDNARVWLNVIVFHSLICASSASIRNFFAPFLRT